MQMWGTDMMVIRQEQWNVFEKEAFNRFVSKAAADLKSRFLFELNHHEIDLDRLEDFVNAKIREAHEFGVVDECDVLRYLDFAMVLGPNFATDGGIEWVRPALESKESGTDKMDEIEEYIIFN